MKIETALRDEIMDEVEQLKKLEVGTEAYKVTVDGVTKLMDRAIEFEKLSIESQDRVEAREIENDFKQQQFEDERKDRIVKNVLTGLSIFIPVGVTVWGTFKTLKFEETGTVTTSMGRGFISKLLPKK
jgi:hypothetical protein